LRPAVVSPPRTALGSVGVASHPRPLGRAGSRLGSKSGVAGVPMPWRTRSWPGPSSPFSRVSRGARLRYHVRRRLDPPVFLSNRINHSPPRWPAAFGMPT
jgi:hypothetical protein